MDANSHAPLANFMDLLMDAVCVVDEAGEFVFLSAACERIFGYTPQELIGRNMIELVAPEDRERTLQAAREIMSGQPKPHFENRYIRKDGQAVHIMWSARWSEKDRLRVAVARDISELKQAEHRQSALYAISEAAHAAEDLTSLFRMIHHIIIGLLPAAHFAVALRDSASGELGYPYHVDQSGDMSGLRESAARVICAEVVRSGQPLLLDAASDGIPQGWHIFERERAACWLCVPLNSHRGTMGALMLMCEDNQTPYTARDQELLQYVSTQVATAIERQQMNDRLKFMAQYDKLTGLPNRALLSDRLEVALARARREQLELGLLFIDLDKFKEVNDCLGHAAGDLLLQQVASRLKQCVRAQDTVARMGGDEFIVLIEDLHAPDNMRGLVEKIRHAIRQPVTLGPHRLQIEPSIGMATFPQDGSEVRNLLNHADSAMYLDKNRRKQSRSIRAAAGSSGDALPG